MWLYLTDLTQPHQAHSKLLVGAGVNFCLILEAEIAIQQQLQVLLDAQEERIPLQ